MSFSMNNTSLFEFLSVNYYLALPLIRVNDYLSVLIIY